MAMDVEQLKTVDVVPRVQIQKEENRTRYTNTHVAGCEVGRLAPLPMQSSQWCGRAYASLARIVHVVATFVALATWHVLPYALVTDVHSGMQTSLPLPNVVGC